MDTIKRGIVFIIIASSLFWSCKKSLPTTPTVPGQKGKVSAVVTLVDALTGESIPSGTIAYTNFYDGQTVNGTVGQMVEVAEAAKGTSINIQIVAESGNYLQRKILHVSMTEGIPNPFSIILIPVTKTIQIGGVPSRGPNFAFTLSNFLKEIVSMSGNISRLKLPTDGTLNMYFNPDRDGTGKRLPDAIVNELISAWEWIKNHSNGEIANIVYHRDGTKKINDRASNGEIFVYESTAGPTASSIIWMNSDGSGYAIALFFNSSDIGADSPALWTESMDSLFENEINLSTADWPPLFVMGFKRIAGNNNGYKIDSTHEEQILPDKYSGTIGALSLSRVYQSKIPDMAKPDNKVFSTSAPASISSNPRPQVR
jgi:hypothetical protein